MKIVSADVVDLKNIMSKTTHLYNINRREKQKVKRLQRQENVIAQLRREKEAITRTVCKLERDLKVSKQKMKLKLRKCQRQHYKKEMWYKSRI